MGVHMRKRNSGIFRGPNCWLYHLVHPVGVLTSENATVSLPHVNYHLIFRPSVTDKADVIHPKLSSQGGMQYGSVPDELFFGVEPDENLPHMRSHGAQVAFSTYGVEEPPKFFHGPEMGVRLSVFIHIRLLLCLS